MRNRYQKGELLNEGKTKKIWSVLGNKEVVIIENKNDITAFDDPKFTKKFETKAVCATETTCGVFEILKTAGLPVAYEEQISPTEFVAKKCSMIPLEAVARRCAAGSFLKRHPEYSQSENCPPIRFHRLKTEFFLKTTKGKLQNKKGDILVDELNPENGEEDPLIVNPRDILWRLFHSKKPKYDVSANLNKEIDASKIPISINQILLMENYIRDVFLILEGCWLTLGYRFIDIKIEFGFSQDGEKILIADVIDNDSWRLTDYSWREISKESFRQGEELDEVERKFGVVASLIKNFRVPRQCLALWSGSTKDYFKELDFKFKIIGADIIQVVKSGHKSPRKCAKKVEEILRDYPEGGVFLVKVGMSNGLGPIIAARTNWPVISIPANAQEFPDDLWSSARMPSKVPLAIICSESNAIDFALNILSSKNPFIYWRRQKEIEELDE